jgi:hypothetical protein
MKEYKKESTIILACIIIILVFSFFNYIMNKILNKTELFDNKRDKMEKVFRSNSGTDPDEMTVDNPYDDLCDDPDGGCGNDPE